MGWRGLSENWVCPQCHAEVRKTSALPVCPVCSQDSHPTSIVGTPQPTELPELIVILPSEPEQPPEKKRLVRRKALRVGGGLLMPEVRTVITEEPAGPRS
jgi:hypothetical protein